MRKVTIFEPCEKHAGRYAAESRYRRAEVMVEGGWANSPCPGDRCRMRPGTDFYCADFVAANPVFEVEQPGDVFPVEISAEIIADVVRLHLTPAS